MLKVPRHLDFGGGDLVELGYLEQTLDVSRRTAAKYLSALKIRPMHMGKSIYFSLPTFRRIMFVVSLPGAPGFLVPGSSGKGHPRLLKDKAYISIVTDAILEKAADPGIIAEMGAAEGRDATLIKKFATSPVGRPKKETKNG